MNKSKMEITVLKSFDGFKGEVIEIVKRKGTDFKQHISGNDYRSTGKYFVSYKGKKYLTFRIVESLGYGFSGHCIKLEKG